MASFHGSIDLMDFKGAKYCSGIDKQNPQRTYICVPVEWNDVQMTNRREGGISAYVNINLWQTNEKFRQSCVSRNEKDVAELRANGQEVPERMLKYIAPSHQIELSFSKEYQEKVDSVIKARLKKEHPEWTEDSNEFKRAFHDARRVRISSNITPHASEGTTEFKGQAEQATTDGAQEMTDINVPADQYGGDMDDLPF